MTSDSRSDTSQSSSDGIRQSNNFKLCYFRNFRLSSLLLADFVLTFSLFFLLIDIAFAFDTNHPIIIIVVVIVCSKS